ncbi:MAG TPA: DUF3090 family protein [Acidimicrobiales bacterium]|jgi:uncharacterized repeat protein (TIGR03847 family)
MSRSFELPEVEWATVGTVGPPGQRTFYLQARQDDQLITLKLEKQQVAAIAQFLGEILSDLPVPDPLPEDDVLALAEPVLAEWAVGGLQLAYDSGVDRVVILAEEVDEEAEDSDEPDPEEIGGEEIRAEQPSVTDSERGVGRLSLTRTQAAAIVRRGWDLVNSGRPACALCGHPIDPEGHSCPRTNGHRPPAP